MLTVRLFMMGLALARAADVAYDDDVAILDPSNFDHFVASQRFTVVQFHAQWCALCKTLEPEWAFAAAKTRKLEPPLILAKVDASAHAALADRYNVTGFPRFVCFNESQVEECYVPRERKQIVSFVVNRTGTAFDTSSVKRLDTYEDLQIFQFDNLHGLIGIFQEPISTSAPFQAFNAVASQLSFHTPKPIRAAYSASHDEGGPIGKAVGLAPPAVILTHTGIDYADFETMPMKAGEGNLTEVGLADWLKKTLDCIPACGHDLEKPGAGVGSLYPG